jgi:penicillin-binding protein 1C
MKKKILHFLKKHKIKAGLAGLLLLLFIFCLPRPLFDDPYASVLLDRDDKLLGAHIADDGQWRFPPCDSVPEKFVQSLITFEDKRFFYHPGIDPLAIARAVRLNLGAGEVVSGASTLSMQLIRLARKGRQRTYFEKIIEMWMALRLEAGYSKEEILALYASHAPFGGNVVGLDAAAWKYFGRPAAQLSWAESATLAVLPNAPSLIHPGKNRQALRNKRNRLLQQLQVAGLLDSASCTLAQLEKLPERPLPLPRHAPHLLERARQEVLRDEGGMVRSSLRLALQQQAAQVLKLHHERLSQNGIFNGAALILEVESGQALAYLGNTPTSAAHAAAVDVVPAPRSTGSILKPMLYASMLDEGTLLPNSLVPDVPARYGGYHPKNYDREYDGAVPAWQALARSLNVPSVHMLNQYGLGRFHHRLQEFGLSSLAYPPEHYGLTLILGGAEASLWELAGMYASFARVLTHYPAYAGQYDPQDFRPPSYLSGAPPSPRPGPEAVLGAGAIYATFQAMREVNRPEADQAWQSFGSSRAIAWKTGTSYGFRDAWAIGCTPSHVVAVWVGNADGEGRPGLVGLQAAAPLMFDLFDALERQGGWFERPEGALQAVTVCRQSGYLPNPHCPDIDTLSVPPAGTEAPVCPFHQLVHLDSSGQWRVQSECYSPQSMLHRPTLVLPPVQEQYYRRRNPTYQGLPPLHPACLQANSDEKTMEWVYPRFKTQIYLPIDLDGKVSKTVFEVTHRRADALIYWHMDELFLGQTRGFHQMSLRPSPGYHHLYLVDDRGKKLDRKFEVLGKERR